MKQVRLELEDDLHQQLRLATVDAKLTMHQAIVEGVRLFVATREIVVRGRKLEDACEEEDRRQTSYDGMEEK